MIIFGTYLGGKVKQVDKQWLESKFILIMIPLIPTSTIFVTSSEWNNRQGIQLELNGKSILHGYLRFFTFILTLVFWGISIFAPNEFGNSLFSSALLGGIFGVIYVWSYLKQRYSEGEEYIERKRLGLVLDINALPEWLPYNLLKLQTQGLLENLKTEFGKESTQEMVNQSDLSTKQIAMLYAYLRYKSIYANAPTPQELSDLETITKKFDNLQQ